MLTLTSVCLDSDTLSEISSSASTTAVKSGLSSPLSLLIIERS